MSKLRQIRATQRGRRGMIGNHTPPVPPSTTYHWQLYQVSTNVDISATEFTTTDVYTNLDVWTAALDGAYLDVAVAFIDPTYTVLPLADGGNAYGAAGFRGITDGAYALQASGSNMPLTGAKATLGVADRVTLVHYRNANNPTSNPGANAVDIGVYLKSTS